ncbi:CHASE3 domain-containing protein [Sphingoaurantiacus capsulatus]|uniref:histidine kinase n=1 Tax=Sphingoaurantiacus capsulatus TaxID=1771310 RepID=A0ABV7XEB9_9SPHN
MASPPPAQPTSVANLLGPRGQLPLIAGFLVLLLVGIATVWLVLTSRAQNEWVVHTFEVQTRTTGLLNALQQAETAQRGYLLVGGDVYLQTYENGLRAAEENFEAIRGLTTDNAAQQQRLRDLEPLIAARLVDLKELVALTRADRTLDAVALVRTNRGKAAMDDIRRRLDVILTVEARLLDERSKQASYGAYALLGVTLLGLTLILTMAILAFRSVRRYTTALEVAGAELQQLNTGLEKRVAERTADLTAANEEIQRYAYIVSHDLRAPLVNIMGFTSELNAVRSEIQTFHTSAVAANPALDTPAARLAVEEDLPEAIGFISASTSKMDRLINAILKISRAGGRVLTPERIEMTALVENAVRAIQHQSAGVDVQVAALPEVVSDRLALEQIFGNVVENAVKYLDASRPGQIRVTGVDRGAVNEYAIADNGRGIAAADFDRVFDLFRRSGAQDRPGEGIGLAHVRALVRRLGGTINVESELGVGATFIITLPKALTVKGGSE